MSKQHFLMMLLGIFAPCLLHATNLDLTPYKNRVVLVDFWASWCSPCLASFPWLKSVQDQYSSQGLTILTVNLDENRRDADLFLVKQSATLPVVFDPAGDIAKEYGLVAMPTSLLIDRKGTIRYRHNGFLESKVSDYEEHIRALLRE